MLLKNYILLRSLKIQLGQVNKLEVVECCSFREIYTFQRFMFLLIVARKKCLAVAAAMLFSSDNLALFP